MTNVILDGTVYCVINSINPMYHPENTIPNPHLEHLFYWFAPFDLWYCAVVLPV